MSRTTTRLCYLLMPSGYHGLIPFSVMLTDVLQGAFLGALVVGISLHYHKIVQNEFYGYPHEWFPSVSAAIGDRYPERSVFMALIATVSGSRLALVGLWYLLTAQTRNVLPKFVAAVGLLRTLALGGFTYITSTDDHDRHDFFMISYIVLTIPWTSGCIALSPPNPRAVKYRKCFAVAFFSAIVPMVYLYIQHKTYRVAGAYTKYALLEWSLILLDVAFDAITVFDFSCLEIIVRDSQRDSQDLSNGGGSPRIPFTVVGQDNKKATAVSVKTKFNWIEALDTVAGIYHGFVFWSMLTSLGLVIWYFPLWHMGISGYELFLMTTVSPILLAMDSVRAFVTSHLRLCHLLSLTGILAWKLDDPTYRLFAVGFGVAMACISWTATFILNSSDKARLEARALAWVTGLILSSTVKFAWQTNNPIWPIMHSENGGYNGIGLALGIVAVLVFTRGDPTKGEHANLNDFSSSSLKAALGIGGLLFGMHSLLSDTGTMIMWVWDGYPVRGPLPVPHGWFTVIAMTAGLLAGTLRPDLVIIWPTYGIGCFGAMILTCYHGWFGYYGALTTAFYLMAVAVPLVTTAATRNPAITYGFGFLIYNLLVLFHVWVVAYAFVPGGPFVREHTDWIMMTMMILIGVGSSNARRTNRHHQAAPGFHLRPPDWKSHALALCVINLVFLATAYMRFPTNDYKPYHEDARVVTAGIWTVHFSLDNDMWSSEHRIRDLIKDLELDIVGLLESDLQRIITGNRDTTQFFSENLGMYVDYGPGPNKHTWGAALLSKFPIVNSTHHLLPSPVGELAPAIHATLNMYDEMVDVFVFHSGQEEDREDRRLQAEYLAKLMGSSPRPSILLSYLVTRPHKGNYKTYVSETSGMHDVDPSDRDRWCEYILYKHLNRVGYARISRGTITDTELQVAKFVVPKGEEEKTLVAALDADSRERNCRAQEHEVPEDWRFPHLFWGKGVRGHRYHVFNRPRYYKPS
ncbi:Protein cwh43 [Diatrype stigma]|uniref:Protein cwh43 n=1 Tax=Diatrype stigma TaxID=117547 RepID=A0AAN9US55_9PEZI